jgi:hypothetical protein
MGIVAFIMFFYGKGALKLARRKAKNFLSPQDEYKTYLNSLVDKPFPDGYFERLNKKW